MKKPLTIDNLSREELVELVKRNVPQPSQRALLWAKYEVATRKAWAAEVPVRAALDAVGAAAAAVDDNNKKPLDTPTDFARLRRLGGAYGEACAAYRRAKAKSSAAWNRSDRYFHAWSAQS